MKWKVRKPFPLDAIQYQNDVGVPISPILTDVLINRGVSAKDAHILLGDPLAGLPTNLSQFYGLERAGERLIKGIVTDNTKFFIFADYDVDGLMSGYIMGSYLARYRKTEVKYPERREGYGMSMSWCEGLVKRHEEEPDVPYVVITVDNGIMKDEESAYLQKHRIDVVITDHHVRTTEQEHPAWYVCDPHLGDYGHELCGAAVAWLVCAYVDNELKDDPEGFHIASYLPHVAVATVTDIMPMTTLNACIVNAGLRMINEHKEDTFGPFMEAVGIMFPLTADKIAWEIGPRLNAAGRMGHTHLVGEYLFETDPEKRTDTAYRIDKLNIERKELQKKAVKKAIKEIGEHSNFPVYVIKDKECGGIAGGIAGQLAEYYGRPAVVLHDDGESLKGSARSGGNGSVLNLLHQVDSTEQAGGHDAACGVEVTKDNLKEFEKQGAEIIQSHSEEYKAPEEDVEYLDGILNLGLVTPDAYAELNRVPYVNNGLPMPRFLFPNLKVLDIHHSANNPDNVQLTLQDPIGTVRKFWVWRQGNAYKKLGAPEYIDIAAEIGMGSFGRDKGLIILNNIEFRKTEETNGVK